MTQANVLTFLQSVDCRVLTKTHVLTDGKWETTGYEAGTWFHYYSGEVHSVDDLYDAVDGMSVIPEFFAVRGNVKPDAPTPIRRTYKQEGSVVLDVDKAWLCIDIDAQPADPNRDHIEQAVELLPSWLRCADCVWQFSSSHGFKPNNQLRVHLWFMLARPVGNNSLRAWAKPMPIDGALYTPVQPHYVGNPLVIGAWDPIKERIGIRRADARVAIPPPELMSSEDHDAWQERENKARLEREIARIAVMPPARKSSYDGERVYARIVQEEIDKIQNATEGNRHRQIYVSAAAVARFAGVSPSASGARPALEAAALAVLPKARSKEAIRVIGEGWAFGLANPGQLLGPQDVTDEIDKWWNQEETVTTPPKRGRVRLTL